MNASEISDSVARQLSELWQFHRMPDFPSYLLTTYKVAVSGEPAFERLYIAEAENGDIESATIGGIIKHWWLRNESGFRMVRRPELCDEEENMFDLRPIVKFFIDNGKIVVGERLGPDLICRKLGALSEHGGQVVISDLTVVWTSNP